MDNYPDTTYGGDVSAPWNKADEPESAFELSPIEKLAVAQAIYKIAAEAVKTKTPTNLRGEVDAIMADKFDRAKSIGLSPRSFDVELFGKKVGTYSITLTESVPSSEKVELKVTDGDAYEKWALENRCYTIDKNACIRHFIDTGELPDGCMPETVIVPEVLGGTIKSTALRIDAGKVLDTLDAKQLEEAAYMLLEGGN